MSIHVRGLYISDVKILVHTSVVRILHIIEGEKNKWKNKIKKRIFLYFLSLNLLHHFTDNLYLHRLRIVFAKYQLFY